MKAMCHFLCMCIGCCICAYFAEMQSNPLLIGLPDQVEFDQL